MAIIRFSFLLGASLVSLQGGVTLGDVPGTTATQVNTTQTKKIQHISKRVDCRGPMNVARTEIGLPDFGQPADTSKLPIENDETVDITPDNASRANEALRNGGTQGNGATFLKNFCLALSQNANAQQKQNQEEGTYMYASFTSTDDGTCEAAVEYWRGAVTNFPTLPPVYSSSEQLYTNNRNVSFVGLFNTSSNPTVDCAFITCNATIAASKDDDTGNIKDVNQDGPPTVGSSSLTSGSPSGPGNSASADNANGVADKLPTVSKEPQEANGDGRRLAAEENPTYGLLCLSSPQALKDLQAPFTQEQWDKITGAENSAMQANVFGVLAVGVTALVHHLFL